MEHEIIGHTKKAYKVLKNPNKSFWEKAKEILVEILIIVFAVNFAAFIERTREHSKERSEAKEFVTGLKGDLDNEIDQLQQSIKSLDLMRKNYSLVMHVKDNQVDSLKQESFNIANFYTPIINGRYDGFKSSGKMQTIENDSLRNDILQFYQQDLPVLNFAELNFNDNQKRLTDLLVNNSDEKGSKPADVMRLLSSAKGKIILELSLGYSNDIKTAYLDALKDAQKIRTEMNKENY